MPIRIAFCITELEAGGAERALVELVTRLDRKQFEPMVYCLAGRPSGNPISLADRLDQAKVPLRCFFARSVLALPRVARQLVQQMQIDRPQIVQTFLFHANVVGAWAARNAEVRNVVTGIRVAERQTRWHLLVARWADRYVDRHVCVSDSVRQFSECEGRLPAAKLCVIPNAIDLQRFENATPLPKKTLFLRENAPLAVYIGRLDHQKRVDWLLEVWRKVQSQVPDAELLIVGEGPQRATLEHLTQVLHLSGVHFLGSRADIPAILATADLLVLPSRWEGMPNVVLEAMASRRPVVTTDVEGVQELLGPNAGEQVVPIDAPEQFAACVITLLKNPTLRKRLGVENASRAANHFSFATTVAAYERLYLQLCLEEN